VNTDLENNMFNNRQEWIYMSGDGGQTWNPAMDGGGDPASGGFDGTGVFIVTSDGGIHRDPVNSPANKGGNLDTVEFMPTVSIRAIRGRDMVYSRAAREC
jgi:hypothetical protein